MYYRVSRWLVLCAIFSFCSWNRVSAQTSTSDWSIVRLDQILSQVAPDQKTVAVGDMEILVTNLRTWRNELAGVPTRNSAFAGSVPTWPSGNVYYQFSNNVSVVNQKRFVDGVTEWTTFANLHFIPRTTQTNYILVFEDPSLSGGQSAVGMIGGQQLLKIGPSSWNRPTICHETGHALGLIHEHQRSDRDSFVVVLTNNLANGPNDGNFIKLATSNNKGAYDFLSVMHYNRNSFSINSSLDTLEPLAPYIQFIDIMGQKFDPVLSVSDRSGMATVYGTGPTPSGVVTNAQDSGVGSLRAAMYYAIDHPGTTITFNIPTSDPKHTNGVFTIQPTDGFPSLLNNTTINGATQSGNTNGPAIQINGALAQPPGVFPSGIHFAGSNSVINRLVVNGFPATGVLIDGSNTVANTVSGCYLGIDPSGSLAITNGFCPLTIANGARSNVIGGVTAAARNIISGSAYQGMTIRDPGTDYNTVQGNYVGLNGVGVGPLPNAWCGLQIFGGARSNTIGGASINAHNVFSGNTDQGIAISDTNSDGNIIIGNYIGLATNGTVAIPNGWAGIDLFGGVRATLIQGNFVSGNSSQGIAISGAGTTGNRIQGNYVGLDVTGQNAVPNTWAGVDFFNAPSGNLIGGSTPAARNIISGNGYQGISFNNTSNNVVQGNYIGVDVTGTIRIPNLASGIILDNGARSNAIGGLFPGTGNVISGNADQGVAIFDSGTVSNLIAGNLIGVAADGSTAISNNWSGVELGNGAQSNLIGGGPGARNTISGNGNYGILIASTNTSFNVVQGNSIGVNAAGVSSVPNSWGGVSIFGGARSNLVGGTIAGNANIIANNLGDGVQLFDLATIGNTVRGNSIFSNSGAGIILYNNANNSINRPTNTLATVGTNTVISGNISESPSTTYHLDFYSSPASSPQAMVYLGSRDATTAANGSRAFTNSFAALIPAGRVITATATDLSGNTSSLSSGVVVQTTSTPTDGIPDAWRARYFGGSGATTNSQSCATCDPDHDGMNNLQEFLAGTNPTNALSVLSLTETSTNGLGGITAFNSVVGVVYRLEYRNDLTVPGWAVVADQLIGTGTNVVVIDPASASVTNRFYRARVIW